ncbi:hypothetical protein [Roseomonas sp. WA12]
MAGETEEWQDRVATPKQEGPARRAMLAAITFFAALHVSGPAGAQVARNAEEFRAFWQTFRTAALAGDMAAITRMSRLPVESRGELDDEPVLRLTATALPAAFRRLLRTVEEVETGRTVLQTIRDTPEPWGDPASLRANQARVGSLEFRRGREAWRLATIYRGPEE